MQTGKMASLIMRQSVRRYSMRLPTEKDIKAAEAGAKLWEKLTYFVGFPACIIAAANVIMDHGHDERPEFIPYDHLRIINKRYPWGDGNRTLFFNPKRNALPTGYVDE